MQSLQAPVAIEHATVYGVRMDNDEPEGNSVTEELLIESVEIDSQEEYEAMKAARKANRRQGKLAELMKAAQRLQGRVPTAKEIERQERKRFKKQQKRMELETKSKYPTPKKLSRKWQSKVNQ